MDMDDNWVLVDSAPIPGDHIKIYLYQRDDQFSIQVGSRELMSSGEHGSEDALAELGCEAIAGREAPVVLIGGLGMGYTLAAALAVLGLDAHIIVAELVPAVVAWNRGALGRLADDPLRDPRVEARETDVARLLRGDHGRYDAILLDVDNGPEALSHEHNDWIYSSDGLDAAWTSLTAGGVLAVWSAWPSMTFNHRLDRAGFAFEEVELKAQGGDEGHRHHIWLATKPGDQGKRRSIGRSMPRQ
jgi:spermidine synthase